MKNHKCQNCGAQLKKQADGMFFCEYCRHTYDNDTTEKAYATAFRQVSLAAKNAISQALVEDRLEMIANARRNLYIARSRQFISNEELKTWSKEILKYNPYDVQASFFMLASDKRWGELNKYLRKINAKDNLHLLIGFVTYLTSGQFVEKCILTINDMISSSIPETSSSYKQIHQIISNASKRANSGIFDETLPRDVFVAYSSKDKEKAYELVEYLEEKSVKCFIAMRNLPKGVDAALLYNERLQRAMDNCRIFLFVSSKNSRSKNCDAYSLEMNYIREKDILKSGNENYYRTNYKELVENYRNLCKPRVQYLIEEYGSSIYENQVKDFFSGLTWCADKESVLRVVTDYLFAKPQTPVANSTPQQVQSTSVSDFQIVNGVLKKYNGKGGNVVIPNGVTSIGPQVFMCCEDLTSVEIPNSVTEIGEYAFQFCRNLTSVVIPNSVTKISSFAFSECSSLTKVVIPNSVTWIGGQAFYACTSLTSVVIPASVTYIGSHAFSMCNEVTIYCEATSKPSDWGEGWNYYNRPVVWGYKNQTPKPQTVAPVQKPQQVQSTSISDFRIVNGVLKKYRGKGGKIVIPNSVTSIGEQAFLKCSRLTSVVIPDSVTTIGNYAFSGCSSLTSVIIPNSVTSIGDDAFLYCKSLTSVEIPDSVTSIGSYAFSGCSSLTSVVIGNSVTAIGYNSFEGCYNLTSVVIPNSVTKIESFAFKNCYKLSSIMIAKTVTSIGSWAFYSCRGLTEIVIPGSVNSIGVGVFFNCNKLTIYCEVSQKPKGWDNWWNILSPAPVVWGYKGK